MQASLLTAVLVARQGMKHLRELRNARSVQTARESGSRATARPGRFAKTRVHKASSAESILKHCLRQLGYTKRWRQDRLTGRQHLKLLEAIRQYGRAWMRHEAESFFQHYGQSQERALIANVVSPLRRWFDRAKQFIRELIVAGAMSMSGQAPLGADEIAALDRQAQVQAEYLEGFRKEIEANPPPELATPSPFPSEVIITPETVPMSAAQAASRAELYGNSVWQTTLNTGREIVKKQSVFDAERRVHLKAEHEHNYCKTCIRESLKGWVPVGTLREIGDSECMGNCDCYFEWMAPGGAIHVSPWGRHNPKGFNEPGRPGTKLPGIAYPLDVQPPLAIPPQSRLPRFGPTNAKIITDPDQNPLEVGKAVIGKSVSLNDLASLSGATDSGKVYIYAAGHKIELSVDDPKYTAYRVISRDKDGSLVMKAAAFHVHEGEQGKGIGQEVFGRMVETGQRLGVDRITTDASRSSHENGYYTWPRFGYDGPLAQNIKDKLPPSLKAAQTVQDLFTSQEGRDWWRINGESTQMTFDLTPGSLSQQRWEAYRRAKQEQSSATSQTPISGSQTKPGPSMYKEPRIKVSPSSEGPDYEYWEAK